MSECTKRKLEQGYDDGSGMERITDNGKAVLALRWGCSCCQDLSDLTEEENAFAKKVIDRWNAFEDGGIVEELRTACGEAQKVFGFIAENYKSAPHFPNAERLVEAALAKS